MTPKQILAWARAKVLHFGKVPGVSQRSFTSDDEPKMRAALALLVQTEGKLIVALGIVETLSAEIQASVAEGKNSMELGKAKNGKA